LNIHFFNASQNGRAVLLCKERPTSLNSKPRVSAAAWTRWRISALVDPVLFKTRLAVATPQPALNATSLIVAFWCNFRPLWKGFQSRNSLRHFSQGNFHNF
jgi:hypothetical protein